MTDALCLRYDVTSAFLPSFRAAAALVRRAVAVDHYAVSCLVPAQSDSTDVYVMTPFGVIVARRVAARCASASHVAPLAFMAQDLEVALSAACSTQPTGYIDLSCCTIALWPASIPPSVDEFVLVDCVSARDVSALARAGQRVARMFPGLLGPPCSLLDHTVMTVCSVGHSEQVSIPMRMIFALRSLGLIVEKRGVDGGFPQEIRVSHAKNFSGQWIRMDTAIASAYYRA